jgi:hypothetical protein
MRTLERSMIFSLKSKKCFQPGGSGIDGGRHAGGEQVRIGVHALHIVQVSGRKV